VRQSGGERQKQHMRRKEKGRELSSALDKVTLAWAAAVIDACALSTVSVVIVW
jgi:hypothetical protein